MIRLESTNLALYAIFLASDNAYINAMKGVRVMAELKPLKNHHGLAVTLSDTDWYDLNLLYCFSENINGAAYKGLDDVVKTVFELGIQVLKEEMETQMTLKELTQNQN
jgi:hypothetical protein